MQEPIKQERADWRQRAVLGVGMLALVLASGLWIYKAVVARQDEPEQSTASIERDAPAEPIKAKPRPIRNQHGSFPPNSVGAKSAVTFLESFGKADEVDNRDQTPAPANDALERKWQMLEKAHEQLLLLEEKLNAAREAKDAKSLKDVEKGLSELAAETDRDVAALEKRLSRARQARPKDPVPQWLTGELLIFVRGEPALILPYLKRAGEGGLDTARLWASLSRVQLAANQMNAGYAAALKALERDAKDRYAWEAFATAAFAVEQFNEVPQRLMRAHPGRPPAWAKAMLDDAVEAEAHWKNEQTLRKAEKKADDLPRVRLVIEHRRFVTENGKPTGKIESTGTDEVVLDLFEDQAPATVANFITLVSQKFYDGTKFFLSDPGQLVAGGCPLTKNADPADDGSGGPGYTIPDEFGSAKTRRHFRGSLSMVNSGDANSAGSRFLITLVPQPRMDGRFTVFGRVIKGQDAIERITQGRTHPDVGPFGRIIPGDVIVRAEALRKRPHEYRLIKAH